MIVLLIMILIRGMVQVLHFNYLHIHHYLIDFKH
nr:MAG TPA: hypothetical protein [Caudoviricetes sp.]DAS44999.1 MAG TPA: hypothetical protein [Caudoviricetes sp.]